MSKKNRKNRNKQTVAHIKAQRGLDRQHFLDTNGDMKQWRPPRIVIPVSYTHLTLPTTPYV